MPGMEPRSLSAQLRGSQKELAGKGTSKVRMGKGSELSSFLRGEGEHGRGMVCGSELGCQEHRDWQSCA